MIDSSLRGWCDSIIQSDINPSLANSVTSNSPCGNTYDSEQTSTVGSKISSDSERATAGKSREILYSFWKEHPTVRENCCFTNTVETTLNEYIESLIKFDDNFYEYVSGLTESVAVGLRDELASKCSSDGGNQDKFCSIEELLSVINLVSQLPSSKADWTEETRKHEQAILVSFALLKEATFPNLNISETDILVKAASMIINLIHHNEIDSLEKVLEYLPASSSFPAASDTHCDLNNLCLFGKIVEKTQVLIEQVRSDNNGSVFNGKKRLILNAAVDYEAFLSRPELDVILDVLFDQDSSALSIGKELKKQMSNDFSVLQGYIKNLKKINYEIGKADFGFIVDRVQFFNNKIEKLVPKMEDYIAKLIALTAVGSETASDTIQAAFEIASIFNPLLIILADYSSPQSLDATADLVSIISNIAELSDVSLSLETLKNKAEDIQNKFEQDVEFYESIKNAIKNDNIGRSEIENAIKFFFENKDNFVPKVSKQDILDVGSTWISIAEATCQTLNTGKNTSAEVKKLCSDTPAAITQVFTTYVELFEFQFELIATLASFIESKITIDAADELSHEYASATRMSLDSEETEITLSLVGSLSYIVHKTHESKAIHLYCNILQYAKGGNRPFECNGLKTDIAFLLADSIPKCVSETYSFFHNVPTKPASDEDTAFIDINQLYSGEWVPFQIPNSQWLVDKKWLKDYEKDYSIYVQQMEVYLPSDLGEKVGTFHILANPVVNNAVQTGGTEFIITQSNPLINEYQMSPSKVPCQLARRKFKNPYTYCEESDGGEICGLSLTANRKLYPSIYTHWNIKVVGAENLPVPKPATHLELVVGMKLCKIKDGLQMVDFENFVKAQYAQPCCPDGQYRPNAEVDCEDCPPNSHSFLSGYYCESECSDCA